MSRVILHIGTHKTATTTIQDMFAHNAALLAEHGIVYPRLGWATGHHGLVTDWVKLPKVYALPAGSLAHLRRIAADYAATDQTVFLSSEEFSRGDPNSRPDFRVIRDVFSDFDKIEVVCVLREQWQFIQSIYLEVSKIRQPHRPPEFLESALSTNMAEGLWTDYNLLYDHLLDAFAPEEIRFVDFNQARKGEGGVIGAMLRHLGIALALAELAVVNDGHSNVSPRAVPAWAANIVAAPYAALPWLVDAVTGAFDVQFGTGAPSCLWTPEEMQKLSDYGVRCNTRLAERLSPYQPDFGIANTAVNPTSTIHRDRLQTDFWVRASRWIFAAARSGGMK